MFKLAEMTFKEVIGSVIDRSIAHDFLLTLHSAIIMFLSSIVSEIERYLWQIANLYSLLHLHLAPRRRVTRLVLG